MARWSDWDTWAEEDERISVPTLLHYLKASHTYYLDFQLPFIRREWQESITEGDAVGRGVSGWSASAWRR